MTKSSNPGMRLIHGREFLMGCDDAYPDEAPTHLVSVIYGVQQGQTPRLLVNWAVYEVGGPTTGIRPSRVSQIGPGRTAVSFAVQIQLGNVILRQCKQANNVFGIASKFANSIEAFEETRLLTFRT